VLFVLNFVEIHNSIQKIQNDAFTQNLAQTMQMNVAVYIKIYLIQYRFAVVITNNSGKGDHFFVYTV